MHSGWFESLFCCLLIFFKSPLLKQIFQEFRQCQTVWIQSRPDILSELISVLNYYLKSMPVGDKIAASKGKDELDAFSNQTGCQKHEFLNIKHMLYLSHTQYLNGSSPFSLTKYFYRQAPPVHVHTFGCKMYSDSNTWPIFWIWLILEVFRKPNILVRVNFYVENVGGHRYFCGSHLGLLKVKILNWNMF